MIGREVSGSEVAVYFADRRAASIRSIELTSVDGSQLELGRIEIQRDWARRYVLQEAVTLGKGDTIVMSIIPSQSDSWSALTAERSDPFSPIHLALALAN